MTNTTTKKPAVCFAHNHMTPAEFGLYSYLRGVSSKNNFLYRFDDRRIAGRFAQERGSSKSTLNALRNALADKHWIQWLEPNKRVGGQFAPRLGRILSHKEYAEKHPGSCCTCPADGTGTCPELGGSPVQNDGVHLSSRLDIKGNTLLTEKKPNENPASGPVPLPSPLPPADSAILAPAAHLGAPVQPTGQDVLITPSDATRQADALCSRFQPANELSELPSSVQKLAVLIEGRVHVTQKTSDLPNLDKLAKITPSQAETIFHWIVTNSDPFWSSRLSGSTALRFLCKHVVTIAQQRSNELRRSKPKPMANLKAASVAPDPAKPFQYQGETI